MSKTKKSATGAARGSTRGRIRRGLLVAAVVAIGAAAGAQTTSTIIQGYPNPVTLLPGKAIPQFVDPLPTLRIAPQNGTMTTILGSQPLAIHMCEFRARILPSTLVPPAGSTYAGYTWVWGYLPDPGGLELDPADPCPGLVAYYHDLDPRSQALPAGVLDTYIGPVIVNQRGVPTEVTWINDLGSSETTHVLAYKYSTDQTLHWADPLAPWDQANECMMKAEMKAWTDALGNPVAYPSPDDPCARNYAGPIPAVTHLHGAEDPAQVDGSPDSWFTSDGLYVGHKYYSKDGLAPKRHAIYTYPNTQEAAPIWFHDHTLGATRLNVYAGMAGAYFIEDPDLDLPANLQPLAEVIPLVLQDRSFDSNGQLFLPGDAYAGVQWALNPEHPYWVPEFVGDTVVVNGKAWPYLEVEPRRYRFLFLNGSNARAYEMFLTNTANGQLGPPLWVIGSDGGYLDAPVAIDPGAKNGPTKLVMMPGERYEVIIDFGKVAPGTDWILKNIAKAPYPAGAPPQGSTLGRLMQFRVRGAVGVDTSYDPASGTPLRTGAQRIVSLVADPIAGTVNLPSGQASARVRELTLNEVMAMPVTAISPVTGLLTAFPGGPLEILVNNTKWSGKTHTSAPRADFQGVTVNGVTTYFSEMPREGETEVWEIVNLTADAHPIHLHLLQFQILNRQRFNTNRYGGAYAAAFTGAGTVSVGGTTVPLPPLPAGCVAGTFCPAYGPPLPYAPGDNPLSGGKYGGNPDVTPYLQGPVRPPDAAESGWKDTVITYPGQVTRLAVRWAPNGAPVDPADTAELAFPFDPSGTSGGAPYQYNYVWHCHIIDHEDNEMMRPDVVQPMSGVTRTFRQGTEF